MAATKTQLKIQSNPASGSSMKTASLGYISNFEESDTSTVATAVDAASRAFISLTTDTYSDCLLIETFSVNEILAE